MMRILIAGGTGFIGQALVKALSTDYSITVLGRDDAKIIKQFGTTVRALTWNKLNTLDPSTIQIVINLTGESIAKLRWTATIKNQIKQSRITSTQTLVQWMQQTPNLPHLYNASAVGIYGLNANETFTEATPIHWGQPTDFLSEVGQAWEQAANNYRQIPVTFLRFGVVLHSSGGMLKSLLLGYQLGLGSVLGNGQQIISWIHLDDLIAIIQFLILRPEIIGAINVCSPHPIMQKDFATSLARYLHRPRFITLPAGLLKFMLGQMADELLLAGQSVNPTRLLEFGYPFMKPNLQQAFS